MKVRTRLAVVASLLAFGSIANHALAWSGKEHTQLTRIAAMRIVADPAAPADLKDWLKANTTFLPSMDAERDWFMNAAVGANPDPAKITGLCWWAVEPDNQAQDRNAKDNGLFGFHERFMHYVDLEFFNKDKTKWTYQLDLSSLPQVADFPHDPAAPQYVKGGFLPLSREYCYAKFVDAVRAGRMTPEADKNDNALKWAGYLAHYTEDNTQPQHATADYKSAAYFAGMRNSPNVHAEVEYRMIDDPTQPLPELRAEFWPLFTSELASVQDPVKDADIFTATINVSIASYKALPLIGQAAAQALKDPGAAKPEIDTTKFFHFVGDCDGKHESVMQMKAHQLAWAVVRTQNVLVQAWNEAKGPAGGPSAAHPVATTNAAPTGEMMKPTTAP